MIECDLRMRFQLNDAEVEFVGSFAQNGHHALQVRVRLYAERHHFVQRGVPIIEHVVNRAREREQILAINRRDESAIQVVNQEAPQFVRFFFDGLDALGLRLVAILEVRFESFESFARFSACSPISLRKSFSRDRKGLGKFIYEISLD
jgi:hypothetical protein